MYFVDTGLLRKDEAKKVMENYGQHFHMNIKLVDAADRFLSKLAGVDDPEQKERLSETSLSLFSMKNLIKLKGQNS